MLCELSFANRRNDAVFLHTVVFRFTIWIRSNILNTSYAGPLIVDVLCAGSVFAPLIGSNVITSLISDMQMAGN